MRWGTTAAAALALLCGCFGSDNKGDGSNDRMVTEPNSAGGTGGGANGGSGGGSDFGNADPSQGDASTPIVRDAAPAPADECLVDTQEAQQVPVDMYVMLDRSGSMYETTGAMNTGPSKWDAIRDALSEFFAAPESDGLGVGLQYFPLATPGVPETCMRQSDCGPDGGPCLTSACTPLADEDPAEFRLVPCLGNVDCERGRSCLPLGECENDTSYLCFGPGPGVCDQLGACVALPGSCLFYASCDPAQYATPAVPIDVLPGNAMALVDSLTAEMPLGPTPTSSALAGALNHAAAHGRANPERRVIAVLATDGLPTDCLPVEIAEVAAIAAEGQTLRPSVQTYVIGVFSPLETSAMANLDELAKAGGSDKAFLVDPAADVAAQFLEALAEIRGGSLACEYEIPEAPDARGLDFDRVNVTLTRGDDVSTLFYVETPAGCDGVELGWYYDVPPADGTPTKIQMCDQTCGALRVALEAKVDIRLGCTSIRPD